MPIIQEGQQARQKALIERAAIALNRIRAEGMIYSPAYGDTAFTVPLFDGFMQRSMPPPRAKNYGVEQHVRDF